MLTTKLHCPNYYADSLSTVIKTQTEMKKNEHIPLFLFHYYSLGHREKYYFLFARHLQENMKDCWKNKSMKFKLTLYASLCH